MGRVWKGSGSLAFRFCFVKDCSSSVDGIFELMVLGICGFLVYRCSAVPGTWK